MTLKIHLFITLLSFAFISNTNYSIAQRHSGMVVNVGVKKHMFSLVDVTGKKMDDFKGNIVPFAGISYAHVLGPKFSATYEFDFSYLKGTYSEKYDPTYDLYPITNPTTEDQLNYTKDVTMEIKSISLSVHAMAHYRIVKGFFVSGGLGYDRLGSGIDVTSQNGQNYGQLPGEVRKPNFFNFNLVGGLGYATDQFRLDLRYNAGLSNMIYSENDRYDLAFWRYDKLKLSHISLTFGYFIGND